MKRLFTLAFLLASFIGSNAQSPRLVLVEEFSGENCGPCAYYNPYIMDEVTAYPTKVLLLKYQVNIPSAGPLYNQNKTDVNTRKSYYGVNFAPWMQQDGIDWDNDASTDMNPGNWLQDENYLLDRANITSPFTIDITHSFSADADSFFARAIITASQKYKVSATGKLKFRFAMTEEVISFATPPGTNGETEFHNVMRKMYPAPLGTALRDSFDNAQADTLYFAGPIPSYIYDKAQIKFIGFIQDDNSKEIQQAGQSVPAPVNNDAQSLTLATPKYLSCATSVTPSYTLKNNGANTLTSCDIEVKLDGAVVNTVNWTGTLAPGASASPTIPAISAAAGTHLLTFTVKNPNGTPDLNNGNDVIVSAFMIASPSAATPLVEGFEGGALPAGWGIENKSRDAATWNIANYGAGGSTKCYKMDFYNSPTDEEDALYLHTVDASAGNKLRVVFDRNACAYKLSSGVSADQLSLEASTDCGATWSSLWSKSGADLATDTARTSSFTPNSAKWVSDSVTINVTAPNTTYYFRFAAKSDYGNNLYLDNINIYSFTTTGIEDEKELASVRVFPNPAMDKVNIAFTNMNSGNVKVSVINALGEVVALLKDETMSAGEHQINWNAANTANGIYTVKIESNGNNVTRKVVVAK
jgi:archaellum component FlaF (FlaF/FlaG flagellin family)